MHVSVPCAVGAGSRAAIFRLGPQAKLVAFGKRWLHDLSRGRRRRRLHSTPGSPRHEGVPLKLADGSSFTGLCVCPGSSCNEEVRTSESRRGCDMSSEVKVQVQLILCIFQRQHGQHLVLKKRMAERKQSPSETHRVRATSSTRGPHRFQLVYSVQLQCEQTCWAHTSSVSYFTQQADINAMSD